MKLFKWQKWNSKTKFSPDYKQAKYLAKRRLKAYLIGVSLVVVIVMIVLVVLISLNFNYEARIIGLALILIHLFVTSGFFVLFDIVPANKIRKNNFKIPHQKQTIGEGQTFFVALRYVAYGRLLINLLVFVLLITPILISF